MELLRRPGEPPQIVAHRGASDLAPENTLAAFERARQDGADIIELDVQVSRDGEVVVFHDESVERTTGGSGRISELTLAELRALDAGSWFAPRFAGEHLPTLREVLAWNAEGEVGLFLELKYDRAEPELDPRLVPAVVDLVREFDLVERVALISFRTQPLLEALSLLPALTLGPMDKRDPWGQRWAWLTRGLPWLARFKALRRRLLRPLRWTREVGGTMLSPNVALVTPVLVEASHALEIPVCPGGFRWDYPRMIAMGVDTISSNDPGALRARYLQ